MRWSAARGFLKPALARPNLRLETGVLVERVLFEGARAVGVRFRRGRQTFEARAQGEVILAAGAIGSPQILQLSGIGPAPLLREHGIDVVQECAGVGENLHDHLQIRIVYRVQGTRTLNRRARSWLGKAAMGLEWSSPAALAETLAPVAAACKDCHGRFRM